MFESYSVGNPEDRFPHVEAHIRIYNRCEGPVEKSVLSQGLPGSY